MSVQSLLGSRSLVAVGIGAGDVATLVTLGQKFGNWLTAERGDADLLSSLEEDEFEVLRRRGGIDIIRFKARWNRSLRILENGVPRRFEGNAVEELLETSSRFTVVMTCITAVLDEFASSHTLRNICKALLKRLLSSCKGPDMTEDLLDSGLRTRINGWRSAAAVREMNTECRKLRQDLQKQGRVVAGHMPAEETEEVVVFLYWLLAETTEVHQTSSSDIAGIAYCLCHLSFEALTVENFGIASNTRSPCRLIFTDAPFFDVDGTVFRNRLYHVAQRKLSTTVPLNQPEETFSIFPITSKMANRCRAAWDDGAKAGKFVYLEPAKHHEAGFSDGDLVLQFRTDGSPTAKQGRHDSNIWKLGFLLAAFGTQELFERLEAVLGRESEHTLSVLIEIIVSNNGDDMRMRLRQNDPVLEEAFTVCQAFFMGYYYQIFSQVVDTSTLEVKTVIGSWGYRCPRFLRMMKDKFNTLGTSSYSGSNNYRYLISRAQTLAIVAMLYANIEVQIPERTFRTRGSEQEACMGVVGKRIVLTNSLLHTCKTVDHLFRFVILDADAGGIPCTSKGHVLTGIPKKFPTWEGNDPGPKEAVSLMGPGEHLTRHIQADWDGVPDRLLLCIRYKGRRVGLLNPAHADYVFWKKSVSVSTTPTASTFGPAYTCGLHDVVQYGRLPTPSRVYPNTPVVVHSMGSHTFRYAVAAWYSEFGDVVFVNDSLSKAHEHWAGIDGRPGARSKDFVALIG